MCVSVMDVISLFTLPLWDSFMPVSELRLSSFKYAGVRVRFPSYIVFGSSFLLLLTFAFHIRTYVVFKYVFMGKIYSDRIVCFRLLPIFH